MRYEIGNLENNTSLARARIILLSRTFLQAAPGLGLDGIAGPVATPVLVLTTESDVEKKARARAAGATGWIVKPFDPAKLVDAVRRVAA